MPYKRYYINVLDGYKFGYKAVTVTSFWMIFREKKLFYALCNHLVTFSVTSMQPLLSQGIYPCFSSL